MTRPREQGATGEAPVTVQHLPGLLLEELRSWLVGAGQERYRADQIAEWIFTKHADSFDQMTNLPQELRAWLSEHGSIYRATVTRQSVSHDGARKLLLTLPDGAEIETVWIPDGDRHTACLSSQVGCPVGCRFCASGLGGLERNLTAGEIVEQALRIRQLVHTSIAAAVTPRTLTNVVLMGIGEPLANYREVIQAIRIINAPWGLGIGARKITLSTVGLPEQIRRLAEEGLQLNLALSLHAPDDGLRQELVPWGKASIAELLDACDYYFQRTGREITLEYVLLADVNDSLSHARDLAQVARRLRCNVNLLRYNLVPGLPFERPSAAATHEFQHRLRHLGVNAHVRKSRGRDVDAACGQLRRSEPQP